MIFSTVCAAIAIQPIPFADIFILTPLQAYMGVRISAIRRVPLSEKQASDLIKEIMGVVGMGMLAQQLGHRRGKALLPDFRKHRHGAGGVRPDLSHRQGWTFIWSRGPGVRPQGRLKRANASGKDEARRIKRHGQTVGYHYIRRNFDEAAILAVAAKLAFEDSPVFSESELATIAAMQRAQARNTPEELERWLAEMDEDQINGVVNNTKGVLHEMEFVRIENEDGDQCKARIRRGTTPSRRSRRDAEAGIGLRCGALRRDSGHR